MNNLEKDTLVIGEGEIGKSLAAVLTANFNVFIRDKEEGTPLPNTPKRFQVINICFPFSSEFTAEVNGYIAKYKPELTIIHSTVPVGTTKILGRGVVHSPVNGRHPHLEHAIRAFKKFVGANDTASAYLAAKFFERAGLNYQILSSSASTELAKLGCTRRYGAMLTEMKEFERDCDKFGVPFHEAYTNWNNSYNEGYQRTGELQFIRPIFMPIKGQIGGHCVIPNLDLLPGELSDFIRERNRSYGEGQKPLKGASNGKGRTKDKNLAPRAV